VVSIKFFQHTFKYLLGRFSVPAAPRSNDVTDQVQNPLFDYVKTDHYRALIGSARNFG
jgi:hypothetical protein